MVQGAEASVRRGDDLEEVAARILEVHAAAAVVMVDLALLLLRRVGPVVEAALFDAAEDLVELLLAHEERVVLRFGLVVRVAEIERHAVRELDGEEIGAERLRRRQSEELSEKLRRRALVAHVDDGVVELDGHGASILSP